MRVRRKKMTSFEKNQKLVTKKKRNSLFSGRENKRRRRESDKIHIPHEIVEEIIVKLPVKSLSRFKSVSKHWRNTFTSKDFEGRHMSHQKTQDPKLLFVCDDLVNRADNALFLKTMAMGTTSASVEDKECLEFQEIKGFLEISESCDGLVCIYGMKIPVEVLNPVTTTFTTLPLAKIQKLLIDYPGTEPVPFTLFTRFGFGKDCVTGRYKLVWLYNKYPDSTSLSKKKVRCEVLDLEEKKWRFVNTTPLDHHHILFNQRPVFVNGSLYWLTGDEEGDPTTETKLIVFDIHTEMFQVIQTPPFISRDASGDKIGVCNLDGRLCISELKKDCQQEFWWRAEDNNTWERIFSVDLHSTSTWFGGITSQPLTPLTISKYTNKVILSLTDQESLVAFDLDPNSMVYHLYFSGYYGLAVPYFPSLLRP